MKITPRYTGYKNVKEQEAPPVQKTAESAPTGRKSEKPQSKKSEIKKSKIEVKKEEEIIEVPKKRSLLEEVLEEQAKLED